MFLAHTRISRTANVQSELYIAAGDEPNAFAGPDATGRNIMGINVGMVKLVGADASVYAALIGHEAAHLAKGHGDVGKGTVPTPSTSSARLSAPVWAWPACRAAA